MGPRPPSAGPGGPRPTGPRPGGPPDTAGLGQKLTRRPAHRRHDDNEPSFDAETNAPAESAERLSLQSRIRRRVQTIEPDPEAEPITSVRRSTGPRAANRLGRAIATDNPAASDTQPAIGYGAPFPGRGPRRSGRRFSGSSAGRSGAPGAPGQQIRPGAVELVSPVTVRSFSEATGIRANIVIRKLMEQGSMARITDVLSPETAELLGIDFGVEVKVKAAEADLEKEMAQQFTEDENPADLQPRPPIVTFLGHVDHGKTSLLDAIRKTSVAAGEAGGITQHIGAYRAEFPDGRAVVFLDTPGHEAFTAMRARGANVTDVVVLVVAADDGVMPQTEEAIDHAKAAGVPIIVALNKCDKPEANPARVKQQLAAHNVLPEEWGGDVVCVETSAITGKGLDTLVEMIALVAELRELKANPNRRANGVVLEARIVEGRGVVASVLVQNGSLQRGDWILAGAAFGRVKDMINDKGKRLRIAGPATPVEISGFDTVPEAGEKFYVAEDSQQVRAAAEQRRERDCVKALTERPHVTLESFFSTLQASGKKELRVILKGDVKGTMEALDKVVREIGSGEVKINILRAAVGGISASDVLLADASDAIIVGLHVVPDGPARALADAKGVEIRTYDIIYHAVEELRKALEGLLEPEEKEIIQGHAHVLRIFKISRLGAIAGCSVRDGVINRTSQVRLIRDGVVVYTGRIASLRREKDDAREVREGFECGIRIENFDDVKVGDVIEAYTIEKIRRTLPSEPGAGGQSKT